METVPKRPGLHWFATVLSAAGVLGIVVAFGIWKLGGRPDRDLALTFGFFGFAALCFGNAAWGILRSVRRSAAGRRTAAR